MKMKSIEWIFPFILIIVDISWYGSQTLGIASYFVKVEYSAIVGCFRSVEPGPQDVGVTRASDWWSGSCGFFLPATLISYFSMLGYARVQYFDFGIIVGYEALALNTRSFLLLLAVVDHTNSPYFVFTLDLAFLYRFIVVVSWFPVDTAVTFAQNFEFIW